MKHRERRRGRRGSSRTARRGKAVGQVARRGEAGGVGCLKVRTSVSDGGVHDRTAGIADGTPTCALYGNGLLDDGRVEVDVAGVSDVPSILAESDVGDRR